MPRTRLGDTYHAPKEERMHPPEGKRKVNKTVSGEHVRLEYGESGLRLKTSTFNVGCAA